VLLSEAVEVAVLEVCESAWALLPALAHAAAVLKSAALDSDALSFFAEEKAFEWSEALTWASLLLRAFA